MYAQAKPWSPFKGCEFDCTYCKPSFQTQSKRQMRLCRRCYDYIPHEHPERLALDKIPSAPIVFAAGNSDISFCEPAYTRRIIEAIKRANRTRPRNTYYFQSKQPEYFRQFVGELPTSVILVTTLETNSDAGYELVSKAPVPSERYRQFRELIYPRKVMTIEPVMNFDVDEFSRWIIDLNPEYIWLGFNSRPNRCSIPEPSREKVVAFAKTLKAAGIEIREKDLRGIEI
jgi:hypothetical protein